MFNLSKKDGKIVDLYITEKSVRVIVDKRDTYYVMQCGMMDEATLQFDTELDLSALITRISDTKHSAQVNAVTKQESSTTQTPTCIPGSEPRSLRGQRSNDISGQPLSLLDKLNLMTKPTNQNMSDQNKNK